jgi:hypothetical protein
MTEEKAVSVPSVSVEDLQSQLETLKNENKQLLQGYVQRGVDIAKLMGEVSRMEKIIFQMQGGTLSQDTPPTV